MEKTTLYLPSDLQRALREAALRERRSQADVVRDALARYLAERPRRLPKSIGIGSGALDDGVDASNVRAWIRENWIKDIEKQWARGSDRADD